MVNRMSHNRRSASPATPARAASAAAPTRRRNSAREEERAILERFCVHELINRYVDALNHRDWQRYADCWTEDCVFEMTVAESQTPVSDKMTTTQRPIGVRTQGREGILNLVGTYNRYPWLFQIPSGVHVELAAREAANIRHILQVSSSALYLIGICYDRAVKQDGQWRLAHRDYRPSYWESRDAMPGFVTRAMPDPDYLNLPRKPNNS